MNSDNVIVKIVIVKINNSIHDLKASNNKELIEII